VRILAVIDSLNVGGAETSLVDIVRNVSRLGHDPSVAILRDRQALTPALHEARIEIFIGPERGRVSEIHWLRKIVSERRIDLVHTSLFEADQTGRVAAALSGVPVVSSIVTDSYGPAHQAEVGRRLRLAQVLDGLTGKLVTRFHAVSEPVATAVGPRLRIPQDRIRVVPRGRDPEALGDRTEGRRRRVRRSLDIGDDDYCLLAVGRQVPAKGFDVLLKAIGLLAGRERPVVLFAGPEGSATPELLRLASSLPDPPRCAMLGGRDDVADLMCAADLLVQPSRREGFPGVLVEALALELPILTTDLQTTRPLVRGLYETTQPESVNALAAAIQNAMDERMSAPAEARERFVQNFTSDTVARQMLGVFEAALDDGPVLLNWKRR